MKSINFPQIFNNKTSSSIIVDREATLNNLKLLLTSEKGTLFGDPYFGIRLKRYLFEQNNKVLKDIIIDEIYEQIKIFIPQITVNRKDIDITQKERGKLVANIKIINKIDFTNEIYSLVIFQEEE